MIYIYFYRVIEGYYLKVGWLGYLAELDDDADSDILARLETIWEEAAVFRQSIQILRKDRMNQYIEI
jgi:hypothetical protein